MLAHRRRFPSHGSLISVAPVPECMQGWVGPGDRGGRMHLAARVWCAVVMAGLLAVTARAQAVNGISDADINKEAATADSLYRAQNFVAALPLYEDLHKRQTDSNLWRERLALSLLGATGAATDPAANRERAHKLLLEAKAAGDNSNLVQILLEKLEAPVSTAPSGPPLAWPRRTQTRGESLLKWRSAWSSPMRRPPPPTRKLVRGSSSSPETQSTSRDITPRPNAGEENRPWPSIPTERPPTGTGVIAW